MFSVRHHVNAVVSFNSQFKILWVNEEHSDDGAVVMLDTSSSMSGNETEMRLALSALFCVSDVPRSEVAYPEPCGMTSLVDAVNALMNGTFEHEGRRVDPPAKVIVLTDGADTSSQDQIVERVVDGAKVMRDIPLSAEERNAAVAAHMNHFGVEMMIVGIGNEVKHFLRALQRAPRVRTGLVLSGATAAQIAATVAGTVRDRDDTLETMESVYGTLVSDTVDPASAEEAAQVEEGAAQVLFGDAYTVDSAKAAVDAAIRAAVGDEEAFKDADGDNRKLVRGLVTHVLYVGASTKEPVPGAMVGSKRGAVVYADANVKAACNKTLSALKGSLIASMAKSSSEYEHTDADGTRKFSYKEASHYTVSPGLSALVAKEMQAKPWCTPLATMKSSPGGKKRPREEAAPAPAPAPAEPVPPHVARIATALNNVAAEMGLVDAPAGPPAQAPAPAPAPGPEPAA